MDRLPSSLLALFAGVARAAQTRPRPDWRRTFESHGIAGTFVLYEPARDRYQVLDPRRAGQRFLPAGTFKIACALVGLEAGAIRDEHEVFAWDGLPKPIAAWEADHTLATGMREGVAWMFQEVARRVGKPRMREWLDRFEYGNRDLGGGIDHFWLQGRLAISALEQVRFLHRLAEGRLPATQRAQRLVRAALVQEKTRGHTLYGKGGATSGREALAWEVGWVERRGRPEAFFALNGTPAAAPCARRRELVREILAGSGVLPA